MTIPLSKKTDAVEHKKTADPDPQFVKYIS